MTSSRLGPRPNSNPTRRAVVQEIAAAGLIGSGMSLLATEASHAAPQFEAYHGVTAAQHQANFDRLSKARMRPVSLSVYGDPPNVQYAAVWVAGPGPAFLGVHGLNAQSYQAAIDDWSRKGFAPTLVSATGQGSGAVFAAVAEQQVPGPVRARHGITGAELDREVTQAANGQQIVRSIAIYGAPGDHRYIVVFHANPHNAKWYLRGNVRNADYQGVFDTFTRIPQFRPAGASMAGDGTMCALFTDEGVGPVFARHGLSAADYQAEFNRQRSAGRMPIHVTGTGNGGATRYAAVFATQPRLERTWSAVGQMDANLGGCDRLVQDVMQRNGVRAAQLTIAQNGAVKLRRAYTYAEPGYHQTQVTDPLLLASNSKMFVAAAIQKLYDAKKLKSTDAAYRILGFTGPKDARSDTITIDQLINHNGGYRFDPTYRMRDVANARGLSGPAGKRDLAQYMYGRDLEYAPGSQPVFDQKNYSNYGYVLLSLVVEKASGQDYFQYLRSQVLAPDGINEVAVYPTASASRPANLIEADDPGLGASALAPKAPGMVPAIYSGDGMVKEACVGSCGLAATATALTQVIRRHAVWGIGGRVVAAREGSTWGASSWAESRRSGTDWAMIMNTRAWSASSGGETFHKLKDAINNELNRAGM